MLNPEIKKHLELTTFNYKEQEIIIIIEGHEIIIIIIREEEEGIEEEDIRLNALISIVNIHSNSNNNSSKMRKSNR